MTSNTECTIATLSYDFKEAASNIKFINIKLSQSDEEKEDSNEEDEVTDQISSPLPQSSISDYPLLAYKSFSPFNNEIVLANFVHQ